MNTHIRFFSFRLAFWVAIGCFLTCSSFSSLAVAKTKRKFDRILTVVMENTNYATAIGQSDFKKAATAGALFEDFHATTHPSQPNYISMVAGDILGVKDNDVHNLKQRSIADLLEAKNLSWKAYGEGYPGHCFNEPGVGAYARKHFPFLSFAGILKNPARCARIVPAKQFQEDWKNRQLPNYMYYVPDLNNDGHDTNAAYSGGWLSRFLAPLLNDKEGMNGTLILITFDEDAGTEENHIYTVMLGSMIKPGTVIKERHDFYDVIKLIEDNFSLGNLGRGDKKASLIRGLWAE